MIDQQQSGLDLLQQIEAQSKQVAAALSHTDLSQHLWTGVSFKLSGSQVVLSMSDVAEIFNLPTTLTRVPGAAAWVKGIANVRGNLMPIIDLQSYLGGKPILTNRRSRVLVINRPEIVTGLLVGDVMGMQRFRKSQRVPSARVDGFIGRLVSGAFQNKKGVWPVLSIQRLISEDAFLKAAA